MKRSSPRIAAAVVASLVAIVAPTAARADTSQESLFQDDNHLVYASTSTVSHVLGVLASLGVDRIRVTVKWSAVAPDPLSSVYPSKFVATDPNSYPAASWAPYDRILELAEAHAIGVDFNVTAPGPMWAMKHGAPKAREADHYAPNVQEWSQFVYAVGVRYSGTFVPSGTTVSKPAPGGGLTLPIQLPIPVPGLGSTTNPAAATTTTDSAAQTPIPRVHYWEIWNEPQVDGWLAPQWRKVAGHSVPNSPRLYRQYLDGAYGSLFATGHTTARDTILIGSTSPEGFPTPTAFYPEIAPMVFLRGLYCVDGLYHRLRGTAATALGCPTTGSRAAFVKAHPGLFSATGFAHHPYFFDLAPNIVSDNVGFVPIANLSRLEGGLDRVYRLYGVHRQIPLYLTEYGYQTKPPDPYQIVSPAQQAAYLNEADYMAYRDPRVRSVAQFLLYDDLPDTKYAPSDVNYWDTFQTGLLFASGTRKPAYQAYRLPIWVPSPTFRSGGLVTVWGQLRPARSGTAETARIQWSPGRGRFRTITSVALSRAVKRHYFAAAVRPPGTGLLRFSWASPSAGRLVSRSVAVTVR
jgi:hypothetical protein